MVYRNTRSKLVQFSETFKQLLKIEERTKHDSYIIAFSTEVDT